MGRALKLPGCSLAAVLLAAALGACGTEKIGVPSSVGLLHHGAVLFSQRCSGCHTLSYAGTHGSAANVRTAQYNNGPNFNIRCERPVARVLYAIEDGGFSGAIMPQNIVVGQDAVAVARFVATYSGRQAPRIPGVIPCQSEPVGSIQAALQQGSTPAAKRSGATQLSAAAGGKVKSSTTGPAAGGSTTSQSP